VEREKTNNMKKVKIYKDNNVEQGAKIEHNFIGMATNQ
jgi:hypothetical protein